MISEERARKPVSNALWILFAVSLTMPFWNLGHPLWEVDDARYAEVPRETVELHDWITPHLDYVEYLEKPPLIYWLGAVSYRAFGVSERTARLPLALLAVLGILGTAWLGSWLFSPRIGVCAGIILGTSVQFSLLSHLQTPDMAVSVFLLWTFALTLRTLYHPEEASWTGPAAGAAMALAFLSKGLIACFFPGAWAITIVWLFPEFRRGLSSLLLSGAIPLFALIVGAWLWTVTSRHPDFFHHFFIEQHFQRFLTPHYNRPGPWYYFAGIDLAGTLPWTPAVLGAIGFAILKWRQAQAEVRLLVVWIAIVFIFFSISKSKLPTYILPIFPQQSLIAAAFLSSLGKDKGAGEWLQAWSLRLGVLVLAAVPAALIAWRWIALPPMINNQIVVAAIIILLQLGGALLALSGAGGERFLPAFRRTAYIAFSISAMMLIGASQLDRYLSAREIGRAIAAQYRPGDKIISFDFYLHGIPFYSGHRVDHVINWVGELEYGVRNPHAKAVVGSEAMIRALPDPGRATFVVLPKKSAPYFMSLTTPEKLKKTSAFGDWILAIF